jgi:hypothetical protein
LRRSEAAGTRLIAISQVPRRRLLPVFGRRGGEVRSRGGSRRLAETFAGGPVQARNSIKPSDHGPARGLRAGLKRRDCMRGCTHLFWRVVPFRSFKIPTVIPPRGNRFRFPTPGHATPLGRSLKLPSTPISVPSWITSSNSITSLTSSQRIVHAAMLPIILTGRALDQDAVETGHSIPMVACSHTRPHTPKVI